MPHESLWSHNWLTVPMHTAYPWMHLHLQCFSLEWTLLGYKQWIIQQLAKCLPICSPDVYPFQRTIYKGQKRKNKHISLSLSKQSSVHEEESPLPGWIVINHLYAMAGARPTLCRGWGWGGWGWLCGGKGCLLSWFGVCSSGKKAELFPPPKPHLWPRFAVKCHIGQVDQLLGSKDFFRGNFHHFDIWNLM